MTLGPSVWCIIIFTFCWIRQGDQKSLTLPPLLNGLHPQTPAKSVDSSAGTEALDNVRWAHGLVDELCS